jgi:hypothetical protein
LGYVADVIEGQGGIEIAVKLTPGCVVEIRPEVDPGCSRVWKCGRVRWTGSRRRVVIIPWVILRPVELQLVYKVTRGHLVPTCTRTSEVDRSWIRIQHCEVQVLTTDVVGARNQIRTIERWCDAGG